MQIYPEISFSPDAFKDRLVIDYGTYRSFLGILPLILVFPGGYCLLSSLFPEAVYCIYRIPLGIFILAFALIMKAFAQYYFTDRIYFDRKTHEIRHETRCFNYYREDFRLSFDQVAGIGLRGEWTRSRGGFYWKYHIVIVSQTSVIIPVTLDFREDRFKHHVEIARKISEYIGREFVEPDIKLQQLVINRSDKQLRITYRAGNTDQGR